MPRENRTDSIEIYNTTDGRGNHFVNIHMSLEAAKEIVKCFEKASVANPRIAVAMHGVITATEENRSSQLFIKKDENNA